MATDLRIMLHDRNAYPDSTVITAPNGDKVPLGEFRGAFFERERMADQRERELGAAKIELANVFSGLQADREELNKRARELEALSDRSKGPRDEYTNGIQERIDTMQTALLEMADRQKKIEADALKMADVYLNDRWESDIAMAKDYGIEDATVPGILKFAVENNLTNKKGLPDLRRAIDVLSAPKRHEKEIRDAEARGRAEAERDMTLRALGRAPVAHEIPGASPMPKFKNMDEAFAAAAMDASVFMPAEN